MRRTFITLPGLLLLNLIAATLFADPLPGRDDGNPYLSYQVDYRWLEIEDVGESLIELEDNTFVGPIAIGFDFPYFGRLYDNIFVCANGMIGFGPADEYQQSENLELPDLNPPDNIVALYWKNLTPRTDWAQGAVYYGRREGNLVIQYQDYPEVNAEGHAPENTITMQVVLKPDGDILLQYKEIGESFDLGVGTVGCENFDGSEGITIRHNGEGVELRSEIAYLLSDHGPGNFLVWDGGTTTLSGAAQTAALRAEEHSVTYLQRRLNQALPADLEQYEAVFINLGNFGRDGQSYHQLTEQEGAILANYARSGGNIYLEGSDFWTSDQVTDVHPLFQIEGVIDGHAASGPIAGLDGSFAEGITFAEYQADDNDYCDHLGVLEDAIEVMSFQDNGETALGMASYGNDAFRVVGASIEFGALVDGEGGTKQALIQSMVEYFREPSPEFPRPINLHATPGDGEAILSWDMPNRGEQQARRRLEAQHQIAAINSHSNRKPNADERNQIFALREELRELDDQAIPARDDLFGYRIFKDGEEYDFTNSDTYTVLELANGEQYEFTVTAVYRDPDGESEPSEPIFVTPSGLWQIPTLKNFEQNNGALTANPGEDGWEWGVPAGGAANGQRAWGTLLNGNYSNLANYELLTPRMEVPQDARTFLGFNHRFTCEGGWDGGRVEYSPDNGERWEVLTPTGGYPEASIFAFDGGAGFSGNSGGWIPVVFDLTPLAGQTITVRFLFKSDDSNVGPGWFIDDLTVFEPQTGGLTVNVRTSADQIPIPGALVALSAELVLAADINGRVVFTDVPAGDYNCTISALGFQQLQVNLAVVANQNLAREVFLDEYDSRLSIDPENIDIELDAGEQDNRVISITNAGGSPTRFQALIDYFPAGGRLNSPGTIEAQPVRDEPWDLLHTINLTEKTGDQYHIAAEFIVNETPRNYKLLTTAGDFGGDVAHFYLMDRLGNVTRSYRQGDGNNLSDWGVRDLAYDGTFVYGAVAANVVRINPLSGAVVGTEIRTTLGVARALAFVQEENSFWVGDRDDTWYKYQRTALGQNSVVDRVTDHGLTGVTGMAWNPSDPDGACLYIHNQESDNGGAAIYRFNPRTRELVRAIETATVEEGFPGGLFTTYLYDTQTWMVGAVIQGGNADHLKIYELLPTRHFVKTNPAVIQLAGGASVDLPVAFDARGRVEGEFGANIEIFDQLGGRITNIAVNLSVIGGACSLEGIVSTDDDQGDLTQVALTLNGVEGNADADGIFWFVDLIPGKFVLSASLPGYLPFASDSIEIAPNEQAQFDEIVLAHIHRGILNGHVRNVRIEDGWMEAVEVSAIKEDDETIIGIAYTDAEGFYQLELLEGAYSVKPLLAGWRAERVHDVEIADGATVELNFELDDRLPMGEVRLNGVYDDRVSINWDPPGTNGRSDLLSYDTGPITNAVFLRGRDDVIAVRFEPEGVYDIASIQTYMFRRGDFNFNGWPGWAAVPIHYRIWAEDPETGLPGEEIWDDFDRNRNQTQWVTVRPDDLRFRRGAFYVGWHQNITDQVVTFQATGLDGRMDYPDVTHLRIDGQWRRFNGLPGDNMIRATVYRYFEDDEQELAPRPLRNANELEYTEADLSNKIEIGRGESQDRAIEMELSLPDEPNSQELPGRDPPDGYKIMVDGQVAAEGAFPNYRWDHIVGSNGENSDHTYQVLAVYPEGVELASPERVGRYNMAPGFPINPSVTNNGNVYTIRWAAPPRNADNTNCIDYAGCRIFINGEQVGDVRAPTFTFSGEIEDGAEGWYDVTLIAYDEVPNLSAPTIVRLPLGRSNYYSFDGAQPPPVFTASPFGRWFSTNSMVNGPGSAHSGTNAWATLQSSPRHYENNANWSITTVNEYFITSPNARLEFFHYMSAEAGRDGGQLLVSVDGGAFQLITPIGNYPDQTVAAFQNQPAWTGEIAAWAMVSVDISDYIGHGLKFRWLFKTDNAIDWYSGWYIDDFVIWGGAPPVAAQIYGTALDQNGQALSNVAVTNGRLSTVTNQQGFYRLTGITPGLANLRSTLAGFQGHNLEVELRARDSVRVDFELYRPTVTFSEQEIDVALGGNDRFHIDATLTNESEITVPYVLRLMNQSPNRDANQRHLRSTSSSDIERDDPGDLHFDHNLSTLIARQRIMGVEFGNDQFFVTYADPANGLGIAILNRDGQFLRHMQQPQSERVGWGLRDLAWDGTFLYGSQNDSIYCFTTAGRLQDVKPGAPLTVNRALAYSRDDDAFWCGEYDLPWYLVNRDGEILFEWSDHGLTGVYGFAWTPGDPDGLPLYISNREDDGNTRIYRSDPERGVIEATDYQFDGPPTGLCITGRWDANRWIMGVVAGSNSQHLYGVELGARNSWIVLNPIEGELENGEESDLSIDIAVPEDARGGDNYSADIVVRAFKGTVATLHAILEIVEGFRHFDDPIPSDHFANITILSAFIIDRPLLVGSEIAAVTEDGEVAGVLRWVDAPGEFTIYGGDNGFAAGELIEFVVWDSGNDEEYNPEVQYIVGDNLFGDNDEIEVRLAVRIPDVHVIQLARGWNLISSHVVPLVDDIPTIFTEVVERNHLVIVKDGLGRFWTTRFDYNGLRPWNAVNGYQVNVNETDSVTFVGWNIAPETEIPLGVGWNTIGYLLDHPVPSRVALSDVMDAILIWKNGQGDFIAPRFGFFGIEELMPGDGYKVKVDRRVDLVYRDDEEGMQAVVSPIQLPAGARVRSTGSDMSLLILDAPSDAIGEDVIIKVINSTSGVMVAEASLGSLPTGVVIRGDDTLTSEIDGLLKDERLRIVAIRDGKPVARLNEDEDLRYETDGFATVRLQSVTMSIPSVLTLSPAFPNPFNGSTSISFGLPNTLQTTLRLLDLQGREIAMLYNGIGTAGWHTVTFEANEVPTGIYWLEMKAGSSHASQKIVLLK